MVSNEGDTPIGPDEHPPSSFTSTMTRPKTLSSRSMSRLKGSSFANPTPGGRSAYPGYAPRTVFLNALMYRKVTPDLLHKSGGRNLRKRYENDGKGGA